MKKYSYGIKDYNQSTDIEDAAVILAITAVVAFVAWLVLAW